MSGGLTRRTMLATAVLAVLIGSAFALLLHTIEKERESGRLAIRSEEVLTAASGLERLVLDVETGQRGFLITRDERFLDPLHQARVAYPAASRQLLRATAGVGVQQRGARRIAAAVESYVRDYSVPLVNAARRGESSARSAAALEEGKRRVDAIRRLFDRFTSTQRVRFARHDRAADADARRAIAAAAGGLAGSILLIVLFGAYLTRALAMPVRRAAAMADRLAAGDLATPMPETGAGEIGALQRSFNTMRRSLQVSRDGLRQLAEEQAALRRVATLVARAVPAGELFDAVAMEVRQLLGADVTRLLRFDDDGTATRVAGRGEPVLQMDDGDRCVREGRTVRAPVLVAGRVWGVMVAAWKHDRELSADLEERIAQFTELVATAIANAESRAELAASRARVVATADETRRRIERDLHDGAQQRLVHTVITLKLAKRSLGDATGEVADLVDEALCHAERATAEVRDLAHGILPASLRRGLRAGIEALASRANVTVTIDVTAERLPPPLEATAYFVVAEALTNVVKHAQARTAHVSAIVEDGMLRVQVRDDGIGGVRLDGGSGLLGLHDRVAAMNGALHAQSPPGGGTMVTVTLPLPDGGGEQTEPDEVGWRPVGVPVPS